MGKKTKTNYNSVRNVALLKSFTRIQRFPFEICFNMRYYIAYMSHFSQCLDQRNIFYLSAVKHIRLTKKIYRQGAITISQYITSEPTTSVLPSKNHQWQYILIKIKSIDPLQQIATQLEQMKRSNFIQIGENKVTFKCSTFLNISE